MILQLKESKIVRFYLISTFSFLLLFGCGAENEHPIPNIPIYIDPIYIYDAEYTSLLNVYGTYVVKNEGYLGNGILIVNVGNNEFKAYDCTCTHEVQDSCWVRPTETMINSAVCRCCGSNFELTYGTPSSGDAHFPLKSYKVAFGNSTIRVYN